MFAPPCVVAVTEGQAVAVVLKKTTGNSKLVAVQTFVSVILDSRLKTSLLMVIHVLRDWMHSGFYCVLMAIPSLLTVRIDIAPELRFALALRIDYR
jgi:uncharacterized membrane protein